MPHFNPKKYRPELESSESFKPYAKRTGCLVLNVKHREHDHHTLGCPCGCEGIPVGKRAVFLMGHDARLRGKLIRAHLTDTQVVRCIDGKPGQPESAMAVADEYGESFTDALENAVLRREGKNRQLLQEALGSERLIKVGRWKYTGQVVAVFGDNGDQEYEVKYVTKTGDLRRVRVPASQTEAVTA